ncbi:hypothetical protein FRB99_007473 [Tulasnella sp. 403]|nr:hypothetical protein FRB99_007473 [Tulasnella sp. 403]
MATARTTRSATRALAQTSTVAAASPPAPPLKRKQSELVEGTSSTKAPSKRKKPTPPSGFSSGQSGPTAVPAANTQQSQDGDVILAVLTFSLDEAKEHLAQADSRFRTAFIKMRCKPFEHLETNARNIYPISWKAARSIQHKFIRLFDPSLPENPPAPNEPAIEFFPSAHAVSSTELAVLRSAGLSARKAEYIYDLACRFADGRLSASKLQNGTDQEVYDMLIEVKGIGPWTVEMFSIFSLRRPNILPVGDLGVQRGLLRWVLASHSPEYAKKVTIAPARLPGNEEQGAVSATTQTETPSQNGLVTEDTSDEPGSSILPAPHNPVAPPATPAKPKKTKPIPPPTPTTASIFLGTDRAPIKAVDLPDGLSVSVLKSRLAGKKAKKNVYLTPEEMEALTAPWAPYRSLGAWFMWSIVDDAA